MILTSALEIRSGDVVAFAGAGGKSSAIVRISQELKEAGSTVLAAPTTKMFLDEAEKIGPVIIAGDDEERVRKVKESLGSSGAAVAGREVLSKRRVGGLEPAQVGALARLADVTLVEADGARRKPLKGTADHEPALPEGVTLVVAVGGIWALGEELDAEHVHRPEIFSELTGIEAGQTITADAFARALARGSLHNIPEGVRKAALITGAQPGQEMFDASVVARKLRQLGLRRVVAAEIPASGPAGVWVL
jgi:probable selenium-dependent hydroxylase accessory protein YqeC